MIKTYLYIHDYNGKTPNCFSLTSITIKIHKVCQRNSECFQWARWRLAELYTFSKTVSHFAETLVFAYTRIHKQNGFIRSYTIYHSLSSICSLFIHVEKDKSGDNYWLCQTQVIVWKRLGETRVITQTDAGILLLFSNKAVLHLTPHPR